MTVCAVLFDGPVGEQALPEAGSLMALGVEEIHLLQKVHQIIRANPGKAEGLFEKFRQILKEEKKEELICNQCPGFNHRDEWDATEMRSSLLPPPSHDTGSVKTLQKRAIGPRRKVAKKRSKGKKVGKKKNRQNMKPRKVERKQSGVENSNKRRKFGKMENLKEKKKNTKAKEASQKKKRKKNEKIKEIAKMKKIKQRRKVQQGNRRTKNLEKLEELKCVDMWAELTNVGLGVATTLKKQVGVIDLVMKNKTFTSRQSP